MADQSDGLATEQKNHRRSADLLAKVQKKLAAQPGEDMLPAAPSASARALASAWDTHLGGIRDGTVFCISACAGRPVRCFRCMSVGG